MCVCVCVMYIWYGRVGGERLLISPIVGDALCIKTNVFSGVIQRLSPLLLTLKCAFRTGG
jgi:hypothetical protein